MPWCRCDLVQPRATRGTPHCVLRKVVSRYLHLFLTYCSNQLEPLELRLRPSQPHMHSCLRVPEILSIIFEHAGSGKLGLRTWQAWPGLVESSEIPLSISSGESRRVWYHYLSAYHGI